MKAFLPIALCVALAACDGQLSLAQPTVRERQAKQAARAAQTVDFSAGNAEITNIEKRSELVANPALTGYIVLISFGQPVAYYTIQGKVTSLGKRLEKPVIYSEGHNCGASYCEFQEPAPSYDGTFGESGDAIYFFTSTGQYVQWNDKYLYSNSPIQLNKGAATLLAK